MKKILSLFLAALMTFTLAGCNADGLDESLISDVISILEEFDTEEASSPATTAATTSAPQAETDITEPEQTTSAPPESTAPTEEAPPIEEMLPTEEIPPTEEFFPTEESAPTEESETTLDPDGSYTTKEDVALYIHLYGKLPNNFISKKEAQSLGWEGGSLEPYAPGMCIGGSYFGNNEGLLPEKKGRKYTECDIDTLGAKSRGAKRIVFSNDGLIYYTDDHYESFTLLYGEE